MKSSMTVVNLCRQMFLNLMRLGDRKVTLISYALGSFVTSPWDLDEK